MEGPTTRISRLANGKLVMYNSPAPAEVKLHVLSYKGKSTTPEELRLFHKTTNLIKSRLPNFNRRQISKTLYKTKVSTLVLVRKGLVIGAATYKPFKFHRVVNTELIYMAIQGRHQGKGYGTRLMDSLKVHHHRLGFQAIVTYADEGALGYFARQNFEDVENPRKYDCISFCMHAVLKEFKMDINQEDVLAVANSPGNIPISLIPLHQTRSLPKRSAAQRKFGSPLQINNCRHTLEVAANPAVPVAKKVRPIRLCRLNNSWSVQTEIDRPKTEVEGRVLLSSGEESPTDKEVPQEYEIEDIVDKIKVGRRVYYQVKWKNYSHSENTWEPTEHMLLCTDLVKKFNQSRKRRSTEVIASPHEPKRLSRVNNNSPSVQTEMEGPKTEEEARAPLRSATVPQEYETEEIVAKRKEGRRVYYLVKWRNYSHSENTWEPLEHLNCPKLLRAFNVSQKSRKSSLDKGSSKRMKEQSNKALTTERRSKRKANEAICHIGEEKRRRSMTTAPLKQRQTVF